MSKKQFTIVKLLVVVLLSIVVAVSVSNGLFVLPVVAMLTAMAFLMMIKKNVKGILADERDYQIAGHAARYAIYIYSLVGAVAVIFLASLAKSDCGQACQNWSNVIAYSICLLMLLNVVIFKILSRRK
jgi:uncharacterized membrane protein